MTTDLSDTRLCLTTAANPGAVAILQLAGPGVQDVLERLTGRKSWDMSRLYLSDFARIDRGLAVLMRAGPEGLAQLMPHGGPRVVRSLIESITSMGVVIDNRPDPLTVYPEADSPIQADALAAVARATSPAAIDRLLAQPRLWRSAVDTYAGLDQHTREKIQHDSCLLDRLITPPTVVVVGLPNVGKSTLTNRLMGRSVSLVADLPGTTRDWVGGLVELGSARNAIAVRWIDTPGLRTSGDGIEQRAIGLASQTIRAADVLIVMRDPDSDWPDPADLPREPDIRVVNKADLAHTSPTDAIRISAATGQGVDLLQQRVVEALGLDQVESSACWAFSDTLRSWLRGEQQDLSDYLISRSD